MDDDESVVGQILEKIVETSSSEILLNGYQTSRINEPVIDDHEKMKDKSVNLTKTQDKVDTNIVIESEVETETQVSEIHKPETRLDDNIIQVDDTEDQNPAQKDQSTVGRPENGGLDATLAEASEIDGIKNKDGGEEDEDNDDDLLSFIEHSKYKDKVDPNLASLSFLYEEEYNDDNSGSDIDIIRHVIPTNYGMSDRLGRGDENGTGCDETESRDYVVEKILDKKIDAKGCALYLVKWEGFPSSSNTWEPIQNLVECDKKMAEFELNGAVRLAKKFKSSEHQLASESSEPANTSKVAQKETRKRAMPRNKYREFQVMDVMGMTQYNGERYYLVSIANSTQKTFIRASLANRVFPSKVIDFFVKNLRWRQRADPAIVQET